MRNEADSSDPMVLKVPNLLQLLLTHRQPMWCEELESAANRCLKHTQTDADRFRSMGLHLWKPHVDL